MKYQLLFLLFIFIFIFMFSCSSQTERELEGEERPLRYDKYGFPVGEQGECYAKCMMNSIYEEEIINLHVYKGENIEVDYVKKVSIVIEPSSNMWIKSMRDKPCDSINSYDCLYWKVVKLSEIVEDFYVVTDTILKSHYKIHNIVIKKIVKEGGITVWKEVVCNDDITSDLINKVQKSLRSLGYKIPASEMNVMGEITKIALVSFQSINNLPFGNLDIKTLKLLGVK